jgi:DNA replication and repair protein RecF
MRVTRLELFDYRNYSHLHLEPSPGLNLIVGPNAQGKTNLLESLYALATTKSARASRDTDLVRFGAQACRIVADVERDMSGEVTVEMAIAAAGTTGTERKLVKVNHGKQARVTDLIGNLNAVLFSSTDLDIVRGEPEERRRFLNYEIAQVSPRYVLALGSYRRALEQRNRLLKDVRWGNAGTDSLDAWTVQIIEHGSKLIERRRAYLEKLSVHAAEMHRSLTDGIETLTLDYVPSFSLPPDAVTAEQVAEAFRDALAAVRRDEIQRGSTLLGPQRDDLLFRVGADEASAVDARTFGSQGQQRTVALSLRLAERRLIEEMVGEPPVVLLDDVLSDLDERRRGQIFALALSGGQTFLTTTDLTAIPEKAVADAHVWRVTAGTVEQVEASRGSHIIEDRENVADPVEETSGEPQEEIPPQTAEKASKSGRRKNRGTEK